MPPLSILIWLPAACGLLGALIPTGGSPARLSPQGGAGDAANADADSGTRRWGLPGLLALAGATVALGLAIAYIVQYGPGSHGLKDVTDIVWIAELGIHYKLGVSGLNVLLVGLTALLFFAAVLASNLRTWDRPRLFYFHFMLAESAVLGAFLAQDLALFVAFFDRDVEAPLQIPINRGERKSDIKGDFMSCRQNGLGVGADFIGHFTGSSEGAVAADDDKIDLTTLHQMSGGIIGDDLMRNFLLREFPGGEGCTLRTRARFVAENVKFFALCLGGIHWRRGRANVHKRQPAGVAMGQDFHAITNQPGPVPADLFAMACVFVGKFLGGGQCE